MTREQAVAEVRRRRDERPAFDHHAVRDGDGYAVKSHHGGSPCELCERYMDAWEPGVMPWDVIHGE